MSGAQESHRDGQGPGPSLARGPRLAAGQRRAPDRDDRALLAELGLKVTGRNVVEFGRAALARAGSRPSSARPTPARRSRRPPAPTSPPRPRPTARWSTCWKPATTPTWPAGSTQLAQARFGLAGAVIALEKPGGVPSGWRALESGAGRRLLGGRRPGLAGPQFRRPWPVRRRRGRGAQSVALVRMALWEPSRPGPAGLRLARARGLHPRHGLRTGGLPGPGGGAHGRAMAASSMTADRGPDRLAGAPGPRAPAVAPHAGGLWPHRPAATSPSWSGTGARP